MIDNDYHLQLLKKSNQILEMTKKDIEKYKKWRQKLLEYTEEKSPNHKEWKIFLEKFENLIYKIGKKK